jgi:hypothetical protein
VSNGDSCVVERESVLFQVFFEDDGDKAVEISSDAFQNIMSRGGWTSKIPSYMLNRVEKLFTNTQKVKK